MPLALLALALAVPPPPAAQTDIAGNWRTQNKKVLVHIGPCGDSWCGKVSKALVPLPYRKSHDLNNPDPALRGRPIIGIPILTGLQRGDDEWRGQVYDPVHGKSYRSIVWRDGPNTIKVKGCIAILCRTQTWDRAD